MLQVYFAKMEKWSSIKEDRAEAGREIIEMLIKIIEQKVYPHYEDARRFPDAGVDEVGDRRSFGVNAYVYGVCLELSNGVGLYEWDEILDELKKIKEEDDTNAK